MFGPRTRACSGRTRIGAGTGSGTRRSQRPLAERATHAQHRRSGSTAAAEATAARAAAERGGAGLAGRRGAVPVAAVASRCVPLRLHLTRDLAQSLLVLALALIVVVVVAVLVVRLREQHSALPVVGEAHALVGPVRHQQNAQRERLSPLTAVPAFLSVNNAHALRAAADTDGPRQPCSRGRSGRCIRQLRGRGGDEDANPRGGEWSGRTECAVQSAVRPAAVQRETSSPMTAVLQCPPPPHSVTRTHVHRTVTEYRRIGGVRRRTVDSGLSAAAQHQRDCLSVSVFGFAPCPLIPVPTVASSSPHDQHARRPLRPLPGAVSLTSHLPQRELPSALTIPTSSSSLCSFLSISSVPWR